MTKIPTPDRFMLGVHDEIDSLSVFEIGASGSKIKDGLERRQSRGKIEYRGIELGWEKSSTDWDYQRFHDELKKHEKDYNGIDAFVGEWDARQIPYPFPRYAFNEIHCHMLDGQIVDCDGINGITIPQFVREIDRLMKSGGRFFFSQQRGLFFDDYNPHKTGNDPWESLKQHWKMMEDELKGRGYAIEESVVSDNHAVSRGHMFTKYFWHTNGLLIATKNSKTKELSIPQHPASLAARVQQQT